MATTSALSTNQEETFPVHPVGTGKPSQEPGKTTPKFLAIKNWDKYQPRDTKNSPWIRDYKDKDFGPKYSKLTCMQRYMLDAICRLRGPARQTYP